jgi:hypothetical protein
MINAGNLSLKGLLLNIKTANNKTFKLSGSAYDGIKMSYTTAHLSDSDMQ